MKEEKNLFDIEVISASNKLMILIKTINQKNLIFKGEFTLEEMVKMNKAFSGFHSIEEIEKNFKILLGLESYHIELKKENIDISFLIYGENVKFTLLPSNKEPQPQKNKEIYLKFSSDIIELKKKVKGYNLLISNFQKEFRRCKNFLQIFYKKKLKNKKEKQDFSVFLKNYFNQTLLNESSLHKKEYTVSKNQEFEIINQKMKEISEVKFKSA